jgi:hypothetical protein
LLGMPQRKNKAVTRMKGTRWPVGKSRDGVGCDADMVGDGVTEASALEFIEPHSLSNGDFLTSHDFQRSLDATRPRKCREGPAHAITFLLRSDELLLLPIGSAKSSKGHGSRVGLAPMAHGVEHGTKRLA